METATLRRLQDELNVEAELEFVYRFQYQVRFDEFGSENELCHVYLGRVQESMQANSEEIAALRFVSAEDLDAELAKQPDRFTPWFKLEWQALARDYADVLSRYQET